METYSAEPGNRPSFFPCHRENYMKVTLYIYAETSVLFVRIFNSLLRDGNEGYMGVFMSI
jgi:hypothetical protein